MLAAPLLASVSVYWKLLLATTEAGPVFVTETFGVAVEVTVAVSGGEVVVPPAGLVPDAVAVLVSVPASMSCCVTTYVPLQVVFVPAASVVTGQLMAGAVPVPLNAVSLICRPAMATLPVLVTRNEYVTAWPAADTAVGDTVLSSASEGAGWKVLVIEQLALWPLASVSWLPDSAPAVQLQLPAA